MMTTLAIETATPVCSVAFRDREGRITEKRSTGRGVHSEKLFIFLEEILREQRITAEQVGEVLISGGPGAYTGLRIGAAAVKGFLFGLNVPLRSIGTLAGMAAGVICREAGEMAVHAVLDARRSHLYHQCFRVSGGELTAGEAGIRPITEIDSEIAEGDRVAGTGTDRLASRNRRDVKWYGIEDISAGNLILAGGDDRFARFFREEAPDLYEPDYLTTWQPRKNP